MGGREGVPHNGLCGGDPSEIGTFFMLQVYKFIQFYKLKYLKKER